MIVNELPIGAKFTYKLRTYKVLRHEYEGYPSGYEDYPSVVCECLDGDKEFIGSEIEFANMEDVEPVFNPYGYDKRRSKEHIGRLC